MKKLLALVLALVMVMGLATVGTSAAYSDSDDIDYSEAVDVMSAVGVFQGKGDAFAPKDGLNRAEAAKLIAYLMLGNKTAESMKGTGSRFTDVPASHWASGYIEYLASVGVVSGVGNNQFNPNGEVTAVQFAKMLLVALGYDAQLEGFVGSDWAINIQKLANDNDLYDELDLNTTDALNREQAAQMCLNDLQADMVKYADKGTTVKIGESTVVTGAKESEKKTTTSSKKGGAFGDNEVDALKAFYLQLGEDLYDGDLKLSKPSDDMGRPSTKWTYKNAEVGTYGRKSDLLIATYDKLTKAQVYDLVGKDAYDNFTKEKPTQEDQLYIYRNGVQVDWSYKTDRDTDVTKYVQKDSSAAVTEKGKLFELYKVEENDYDRYVVVTAYTYLIQATADYNSSSDKMKFQFNTDAESHNTATITGAKEIEGEDFPTVIGAKKDDYFVVTVSDFTHEIESVEKAVAVTGTVDSYKLDDFVTIDGTNYTYNQTIGGKLAVDNTTHNSNATHGSWVDFSVGNSVKVITDSHGYILLVDDANYSSSYVFVAAATNTESGKYAKGEAYFTDGTYKTITIKKVTNAKLDGVTNKDNIAADADNMWYTYSVDSDGYYTLKQANKNAPVRNTAYTSETATYSTTGDVQILNKDTVKFINTDNNYKANNDTVLMVLDDDSDVTVYNGVSNFPGLKATTSESTKIYLVCDGSTVKYAFVDASKATSTSFDDGTASDDLTFVVKVGGVTNVANDKSYYTVDVIRNGQLEKGVKVDEDVDLDAGILYYKLKTNSDGYISDAKVATADSKISVDFGAYDSNYDTDKIDYDGGTLTIADKDYVLNTNSIVLVYGMIDKKTDTAVLKTDDNADYEWDIVSGSTLESNLSDCGSYTYTFFAKFDDDNSNKINELFIWIAYASEDATLPA